MTASTLRAAIERLYATFARYELPARIALSPVLDDAKLRELEARWRVTPLRERSADDLGIVAGRALTTLGTEDDLRHFLPRLLELAAERHHSAIDVEVLFGKLRYGSYDAWPPDERAAIDAYLEAVALELLASDRLPTGEVLRALAATGHDLSGLIAAWGPAALCPGPALERLLDLVTEGGVCALEPRRGPGAVGLDALLTWLHSDDLLVSLEAAFFEEVDEARREQLSSAVQRLEWLRLRGRRP